MPSVADRAILNVFASLEESSAIHEADAALVAAVIGRAAEDGRTAGQNKGVVLASFEDIPEPAPLQPALAQPTQTGSVAAVGIVLAPDEATDYADDEPVLLGLIETTGEAEIVDAELAMPNPELELYRAPEAASDVADLRGNAGPPADRYARGGEAPAEDSFFSRLFASLIE
jgi:hypothetical protein